MRLFIVLILLFVVNLNASMYEKAIKKALESDKLILVEIYSQYCSYSSSMKNKVLRKSDILKLIHKYYIYYRFNIDADDKKTIPKRLYTETTPTYFFVSSDGNRVLEEIIGEMQKDDFKYFLIETYKDYKKSSKK